MGIDQQHRIAGQRMFARDRKSIRGILHTSKRRHGFVRQLLAAVELGDTLQRNLLDVTADGTLEKVHRHPRLETFQQCRLHIRMRCQVEVQAVCKPVA